MIVMDDIFVFVWGRPDIGPFPYLLDQCSPFDEPKRHQIDEGDECINHRIVWGDNTGICFRSDVQNIPPATLFKIYKKARERAEEIEFNATGAIVH